MLSKAKSGEAPLTVRHANAGAEMTSATSNASHRVCCESCDRSWTLNGTTLSFFQQEAIETSPCHHCGAYTLTIQAGASGTFDSEEASKPTRAGTSQRGASKLTFAALTRLLAKAS